MADQEKTVYCLMGNVFSQGQLIAFAKELQVAHADICTVENFDTLLDHFYDLGYEVIITTKGN